jgi:hypothetical protein
VVVVVLVDVVVGATVDVAWGRLVVVVGRLVVVVGRVAGGSVPPVDSVEHAAPASTTSSKRVIDRMGW